MLYIRPLLNWTAFPSLCLIIVLLVIQFIVNPNFLSTSFIVGFFGTFVPLILIAVAQGIVLIGGGLDLSLGAVLSLVNVTIIQLLGAGFGLIEASLLGILMGLSIGLLNGVVVTYLRVNPLLVTLATMSVASGLALIIQPAPGGSAPMDFILWYQKTTLGLPNPLIFVLFTCLLWVVFRYSAAGLYLFALGEDIRRAYITGIPIYRLRLLTYVLASFIAGIGGVAITANIGSGDPVIAMDLTLKSLAACVIGGLSLLGGMGTITGAIFGAIFLSLVFYTVLSLEVSPYFQNLTSGIIILLSIMAASWFKSRYKG